MEKADRALINKFIETVEGLIKSGFHRVALEKLKDENLDGFSELLVMIEDVDSQQTTDGDNK